MAGIPQNLHIGFRDHEMRPSKPLPKQVKAIRGYYKHKHNLFAGGLGPGKTDTLACIAVHELLAYPGNLILVGRKTVDSFSKSTLTNILNILPPQLIKRHNQQTHEIELIAPYRSKLVYPQLDSSKDAIQKVKSMNLGACFFDQLEELDEEMYEAATGQMRRRNASRSAFSTCNPAGHDWVWDRWVKPGKRLSKDHFLTEASMWKKDIPAPTCQADVVPSVSDNIYLTWDYIADRMKKPKRYVQRYVFGAWDGFEGLIWHMAKRETHSVKPFHIPAWWNHYRVMDHGHRNPTAVLWAAMSPDGVLYLYKAHYEADKWVDYHSAIIHAKSGTVNFKRSLADPSMFQKRESEKTIAGQYVDFGLYWEQADNDVPGGIDRVARWFQDGKIKIFDIPEFDSFWDEIYKYHWKELAIKSKSNAPEEPTKTNDHFCDALRYLINDLETSIKPKDDDDDYGFLEEAPVDQYDKRWMGV